MEDATSDRLDEEQFSFLCENLDKINKSIYDSSNLINVISKKLHYVIRKRETNPKTAASRTKRKNTSSSRAYNSEMNNSFRN